MSGSKNTIFNYFKKIASPSPATPGGTPSSPAPSSVGKKSLATPLSTKVDNKVPMP
jgi:hypothetical protein